MNEKIKLPQGWTVTKLGDVATYINGRAFKPNEWGNEGYPIIRIQNLNNSNATYNFSDELHKEKYRVVYNDLLFAWSASLGTYIWKGQDAWLNQHIFKVIPKANCIKMFLFYALERTVEELYSKTHGSGMVHITKGKFEETEILLPTIAEQYQIVEKLEELFSELDKGIENLKTAQQQLKVYRQAVLKSAFEGKLTNENVKDGELPEGWEYKKISDVANVGTGGTPLKSNPKFYDGGTIPWVTSGALNDIYVTKPTDYITKEALNQTNCKIYPKHTLLLAMYGEGKTRGMCSELIIEACTNQAIAAIYFDGFDNSVNPYLKYFLIKNYNDIRRKSSGGVQPNINLGIVKNLKLPLAPKVERFKVIDEIESRLSVCDKIEETITINLQQAEALRQSILKKAFEGKLVKPKVKPLYKPKSVYFYQVQLLAKIAAGSKEKGINHGEMTIAKYAYLVDKIYQIPTYYKFERWHLGPYPPEIKKAITNKKFFDKVNNSIEVKDLNTLSKYNNPYTDNLDIAIADLSDIFSLYNEKHRSHQIELMATVCKVIEDIQSTDLPLVRRSMAEWKIDLTTTHFKNKAEKFSEEETKACIDIINKKKWHLYLIKY